jgi:hypothetical protein
MASKEKRHRRLSASSGKAKTIAAAIVGKAGHNITGMLHHNTDDAKSTRHSLRIPHSASTDENVLYGEDEEEDDSGSDLDDDLPVSGFAVASTRRNADFHAMFPSVDEGDYLIEGESSRKRSLNQTTAVRFRKTFWYKGDYTFPRTISAFTPTSWAGSRMYVCLRAKLTVRL